MAVNSDNLIQDIQLIFSTPDFLQKKRDLDASAGEDSDDGDNEGLEREYNDSSSSGMYFFLQFDRIS